MSGALMAAASLYNDQRFLSKSEIRIYKNKIRRRRIAMCQRISLAVIVSVILFLIFFAASTMVIDAQSEAFEPEYKYYKVLTVHADDSIWKIASENMSYEHYETLDDYISEICAINNILGDKIYAGDDIVVPYFSKEFK
jgi:hypothetical protein